MIIITNLKMATTNINIDDDPNYLRIKTLN